MKLILKLLASSIAVFVAAYLVPGVDVKDFVTAAIVAIVLGLLNMFIKPLLVVLTLPVTIITLGLFYFVINAAIVLLVAQLVSGFYVDSLFSALLFSLVVSVLNSFLSAFTK